MRENKLILGGRLEKLKQDIEKEFHEILDDAEKGKCDIPDYTCPYIDNIINEINNYVNDIESMRRNYDRYDTIESFVNDLPEARFYDLTDTLDNKLRNDNARLRELGRFWYNQFKDMKSLVEKFILNEIEKVKDEQNE